MADSLAAVLAGDDDGSAMFSKHSKQSTKIKVAIVLNQLAATEPPPLASSFEIQKNTLPTDTPNHKMTPSAAASIPASWCYVLVHSRALPWLVERLPSNSDAINTATNSSQGIDLCVKCGG